MSKVTFNATVMGVFILPPELEDKDIPYTITQVMLRKNLQVTKLNQYEVEDGETEPGTPTGDEEKG